MSNCDNCNKELEDIPDAIPGVPQLCIECAVKLLGFPSENELGIDSNDPDTK